MPSPFAADAGFSGQAPSRDNVPFVKSDDLLSWQAPAVGSPGDQRTVEENKANSSKAVELSAPYTRGSVGGACHRHKSLMPLLATLLRKVIQHMFSAAFIWEPGTYDAEFNELNALIEAAAVATPGFIGVEEWASEDGKRRNATYYWDSLDSLKALSVHPKHMEAKRRYAQWYRGYHVVISEVVKSYGDGAFEHLTRGA